MFEIIRAILAVTIVGVCMLKKQYNEDEYNNNYKKAQSRSRPPWAGLQTTM